MAIDAVIEAVWRMDDKDKLMLKPRIDSAGRRTIAGRRILYITKNADYVPQVGDEIFGNAHEVVINEYRFRRIMPLWDGTFEVL